jgi:hypothetical protein
MLPSNATKPTITANDRFKCSSFMKSLNLLTGPRSARQISLAKLASDGWSAAGYQLDQQYHDRDYQKNVDETAHGVRTDESEQPQNQENHKNRPKHKSPRWSIERKA